MSDIARAVLVGRVSRDPQLNSTGKVLTIGVAAGRNEKQQDGSYEDVSSFFDVKVLGNRAQALHGILAKGHRVGIDGQLVQERWTNDAGDNRSRVVILANEVVLLERKPQNTNGTQVTADRALAEDRAVAALWSLPAREPRA
jgi:single-strand DNA-binding protein